MAFDVNTPEEIGKLLDAYGAAVDKNAFISDLEKEVGIMVDEKDKPVPIPSPSPVADVKDAKMAAEDAPKKGHDCPDGKVWDEEKKDCVDGPEKKPDEKKEGQSDTEVEKLKSVVSSIKAELIDEVAKLSGLCPTKLDLWDVDSLILLRKIIKSSQVEKTEKSDKVSIPGARRSLKSELDTVKPIEFTPRYPGLEVIAE